MEQGGLLKSPPLPSRVISTPKNRITAVAAQSAAAGSTAAAGCLLSHTTVKLENGGVLLTPKVEPKETMPNQGAWSVESALVERALDNMLTLPQVITEVAHKQRSQGEEAQHQQNMLQVTKQKLKSAHDRMVGLHAEMASVSRRCYLAEEEATELKKEINQIGSNVEQKLKENEILESKTDKVKVTLEEQHSLFRSYYNKIKEQKEKVYALECTADIHTELKELQTKLDDRKQVREEIKSKHKDISSILSGARLEETKEETTKMKQKIQEIIESINNKKGEENTMMSQLKQDAEVLNKRNAAQLTRLKRQLKEAHSRKLYWSRHAAHLQQSITEVQQQP